MKCYQAYIINRELHPAEYLVQLYSIIRHKELNPTIPIVLLTNKESLLTFEKNGLTKFYDEVRTDLFDDYPYANVSSTFTSFPKVWAISKLETPFVIQDIDLIYHKNMDELEPFHFGYLFKHAPNSYPRPFEVSTPDNFEWSKLQYFKTAFPLDTGFLYFNDESFKQKYTDFYFKFVLNNPGEYVNLNHKFLEKNIKSVFVANPKSFLIEGGINKFAEQFILGIINEEALISRPEFSAAQIVPVLFDTEKFTGLHYNEISPQELVTSMVYHLSGAKYCLHGENRGCNTTELIKYIIKSGEEMLTNNLDGWETYGNIYRSLVEKTNTPNIS